MLCGRVFDRNGAAGAFLFLDVKSLCHYTWAGLAAGDVDFNTAGFFQLVFRAADALFLLLTWYVIGKDMGNLPL